MTFTKKKLTADYTEIKLNLQMRIFFHNSLKIWYDSFF